MARTLWPAGVTGLEAATAALGSVVIESSHRDSGCDGGGVGTRHGHSPDRHGVGPCAAVKVVGGRWLETEMLISRHSDDLMDAHILLQNTNVNHYLRIFCDSSLAFLCDIMAYPELPRMRPVSRPPLSAARYPFPSRFFGPSGLVSGV